MWTYYNDRKTKSTENDCKKNDGGEFQLELSSGARDFQTLMPPHAVAFLSNDDSRNMS